VEDTHETHHRVAVAATAAAAFAANGDGGGDEDATREERQMAAAADADSECQQKDGTKERLARVMSGCLDNLPPQQSKVVRIFTSSTFTGQHQPHTGHCSVLQSYL